MSQLYTVLAQETFSVVRVFHNTYSYHSCFFRTCVTQSIKSKRGF